MTLKDVAGQIYSLTSGGHVNGENYSKKQLENAIYKWLQDAENNAIPNSYVIQMALPDGLWLTTVDKIPGGYDYYIPDTRDQEQRLYQALGITQEGKSMIIVHRLVKRMERRRA